MQRKPQHTPAETDDALVARLYQQHALTILAFIRRRIPSREEAEDILVEVFLAALEHRELAHFGQQQQRAWLQRVAVHKCIDAYRRSTRYLTVPLQDVAETLLADERNSPDDLAMRTEEETLLYEQLVCLPVAYQTVLQLRFAQGLRCTEIAGRLHKSEGAIRMLLSRALTLLRKRYTRR